MPPGACQRGTHVASKSRCREQLPMSPACLLDLVPSFKVCIHDLFVLQWRHPDISRPADVERLQSSSDTNSRVQTDIERGNTPTVQLGLILGPLIVPSMLLNSIITSTIDLKVSKQHHHFCDTCNVM